MNATVGKILIIEDDPTGQKAIKEGYDTIGVANGNEGTILFRLDKQDLLITDIVIPDKDGLEVISELMDEAPDIKIITISGGGRNKPDNYLHRYKSDVIKHKPG